jgi:catechol 2,3-dioxygenase-like lactoylglutathione lyase family enzyme
MVNFYTQTLGFLVKRRFAIGNEDFRKGIGLSGAEAIVTHLTIPNSDVEIELLQFKETKNLLSPSAANTQGYRHFALVVDDLKETWRDLNEKGISFLSEPIAVKEPKAVAGFQFVYFLDPEGNLIELNELPSGA